MEILIPIFQGINYISLFHVYGFIKVAFRKQAIRGVPGWLSRLSGRLQLRSWSHHSWVWALRQALCWQLRAWSLLQILCLPLSLSASPHHLLKINKHFFKTCLGVPGWLSWLSVQLWLRSWSHGSWVRASCRALCWQLRAWSLLRILCLPLSLPLPCSRSVSVSKINENI